MQHSRRFVLVLTLSLLLWVGLFIARIFELYDPVAITKIAVKLEYVFHALILFFLFRMYKQLFSSDKKTALWFVLINLGIFANDTSWYFVAYTHKNLVEVAAVPVVLNLIPSLTWAAAMIFLALRVLKSYILKDVQIIKVVLALFVLNIITLILFLSVPKHLHLLSVVYLSQWLTLLIRVVCFDFMLLCLANARSLSIIFFLSGCVVLLSGGIVTDYAVILQNTNVYSYGELFWFLGLILNLLGLLSMFENSDYDIAAWFRAYNTIRSKLVFWHFISAMVVLVLMYGFLNIGEKSFMGLPLFMMLYCVATIILSTYLGSYFEEPFRKIENLIKAILYDKKLDKISEEFSIEEFRFLQKFIIDAFKQKQAQEEERIRLEREYARADLDNLKMRERLLQEQINLEREKSKADILQLQIDNHKITELEQEKFHNIVQHVVHDIRSPLNTINNFITTLDEGIKEKDRVNLRLATRRLAGIAGNLLNKYKNTKNINYEMEDLLVASSLLQIISEKEVEYHDKNITFNIDIDKSDYFVFIKINSDMFKRMISNLINNAVEALDEKLTGTITIKLRAATDNVVIFIEDNGVGMPAHVVESFQQGVAITYNKESGNGVGLVQVYNTIKLGSGTCDVYTTEGKGTEIVIHFPKITPPQWLCSEIKINISDEIIILDDDTSIHGSWDKLFENLHHAYKNIKITHFVSGVEALNYIQQMTLEQQKNILLLSDYELLKQNLTGLDIIKQVKLPKVVLVTSYSGELSMQNQVLEAGIKMLPKELIAFIPIKLNFAGAQATKKVDFIWLEDQSFVVEEMSQRLFSGLKFDVYTNPDDFLNNLEAYSTDTTILLDMFYATAENKLYNTNGIFIANTLFRKGYTKLYLLTAELPALSIPDYLTVVLKNDDTAIQKAINSH